MRMHAAGSGWQRDGHGIKAVRLQSGAPGADVEHAGAAPQAGRQRVQTHQAVQVLRRIHEMNLRPRARSQPPPTPPHTHRPLKPGPPPRRTRIAHNPAQ